MTEVRAIRRRSTIGTLDRADKWLVKAWRDTYPRSSWFDCLVASGVLVEGARRHPSQALSDRAAADATLQWRLRSLPEQRDRQVAEHEAAHCWVAMDLGLPVVDVRMDDGEGNGVCNFRRRPDTDKRDVVAVYRAGEPWVDTFQSAKFPGGAVGCRSDRRQALTRAPRRTTIGPAGQLWAGPIGVLLERSR